VKIEISKRARRQIEKISRWWVEKRRAAPTMFLDELADAARQLRSNPEIGVVYARHRTGDVRRLLLSGSGHHLYYRYRRDRDLLVVLTVWGSPPERGPKL
jgi:plasmid stabilization system protein ParE